MEAKIQTESVGGNTGGVGGTCSGKNKHKCSNNNRGHRQTSFFNKKWIIYEIFKRL